MKTPITIHKYRKYLIALITFILVGVILFFVFSQKQEQENTPESMLQLSLNENLNVSLFVADEPAERYAGLSVVNELKKNEGMLFIFDEPGNYPFWMKDMKFPIDIIWLDEQGEIVFIKEYAQPSDYPEAYNPNRDARYVLEFNEGFVTEYSLKIGDVLNVSDIEF